MNQHMQPPPNGPMLVLYPLNDSFVPKQISLPPGSGRVKIGRQTNAKTVPGERNGYFDSKVLSRQHAEVWEEGGKIFIKDVKSSNGTFVNGDRLSLEGVESDPWELKSDDVVEFGIDIVGEDNKTIIHHKVAAQVRCILTADDWAQFQSFHQPQQHLHQGHPNGTFRMQEPGQRRPSLQGATSPGGLGGLGGGGPGLGLSGRSGKSGLTFDHILNRLQNELQKSRETGSDLNSLSSVMSDINETLAGGAIQPSLPPSLPPVRPPPQHPADHAPQAGAASSSDSSPVSLNNLQSQLLQTQSSLASQAEKVKSFENVIQEHEQVKHEVQLMRDLMEQRKREIEGLLMTASAFRPNGDSRGQHGGQSDSERDDDDESDRHSIMTITPGEMGNESDHRRSSSDDEDAYSMEEEERAAARARSEAMGRPRTPEPHGLGDEEDDEDDRDSHHQHHLRNSHQFSSSSTNGPSSLMPPSSSSSYGFSSDTESLSSPPHSPPVTSRQHQQEEINSQKALLENRLETLSNQLDSALNLSRMLQAQAEAAQINIERLEAKVASLEAFAKEARERDEQNQQEEKAAEDQREGEGESEQSRGVTAEVWDAWRLRVESNWKVEREEWVNERTRLREAFTEWETRMTDLEKREKERAEEMERKEKLIRDELKGAEAKASEAAETALALQQQILTNGSHDEDAEELEGADKSDVLMNGDASRRWSSSSSSSPSGSPSKVRKQHSRRASHQRSVATPPHSPVLPNGEVDLGSRDHSSESSPSRPPSPVPHPSSKGIKALNGTHFDILPISPAPSLRDSDGRRAASGSAGSEGDIEEVTSAASANGEGGEVAQVAKTSEKDRSGRKMGDNPLPYLSAAGVVFIGIAAYAAINRVKD